MTDWNRRQLLGGACAAVALAAGGAAIAAKPGKPAMTLYRSPGCGCCLKWAEIAKAAGYPVEVVSTPDIMAVKARLGVPDSLASCHTTRVGNYVVEGHVPLAAVARLLRDRPKGVAGIAVPGMPAGSPGMEAHGDHGSHGGPASFEVFAFGKSGASKTFVF